MEVIFLDNGLTGKGEHSYRLLAQVRAVLLTRGIACRIAGAKSMDPAIAMELGAIPHFRRTLYDHERNLVEKIANSLRLRGRRESGRPLRPEPRSEMRTARLLNRSFEKDLANLPSSLWDSENLVVFPAISQNQILGLMRFLGGMPSGALPCIVAQLMFAPDWVPWGGIGIRGAGIYAAAFAMAKPRLGSKLLFTVENEAMARLYREGFGISSRILPIPFGNQAPCRMGVGKLRIGFFGYSKTEKGFHLLPRAIEICRAQGLDADFTVQIQHSGWEPATVAAEKALRALPGVTLLDGVLSSEDYAAAMSGTDVMLLPYDPAAFGLRGSGLFTESAAAGRPIIATKGTFAALSIEIGGAEGEVFAPRTSEALAAAITRLAARLPAAKASAAARAAAFARGHTPEAYVSVLLAHAGSCGYQAS